MIAEVLKDIKLNLNEESLRRLETSFNLNDLRRGIYEVISLYVLRNNLYLRIFKRHQTLEKNLNKHLFVNKDCLSFRIDRLVEECVAKDKEREKKELAENLYLLAKTATAEFLKHVLKQTAAYKNAYAEAEGILARYTIVGTDIIRFFLKGREYQIELVPYRPGAVGSFFWQNKHELNKFKLILLHRRQNLAAQLSTASEGFSGFFKQKELKAVDVLLTAIKNRILRISPHNEDQSFQAEDTPLQNKPFIDQSGLSNQPGISLKDLETVAKLALDLDDINPVLAILQTNPEAVDAVKQNIQKLKNNNPAVRLEGKVFFDQLKEKHQEEQEASFTAREEHLLAKNEEAELDFHRVEGNQKKFKKTELHNPDVQIYSHRKARASAKKNFFSDWALLWRKNKSGPRINTKIGNSDVLDTYSVLQGTQLKESNSKKAVKRINIMG